MLNNVSDLAYFIIRGNNKRDIFFQIVENEPIAQAKIFSNLNKRIARPHISRCIKLFMNNDLVFCKNEKERTYKLYKLTDLGIKVLKKIKEIEEII